MKNWIVKENSFNPKYIRKYESIMCQGNGYMGVRAATEEDYDKNIRYTLVAGTFDKMTSKNTTELPNAADTTALSVIADGIPLQMEETVTDYMRTLNLYTGVLNRYFIWKPKKGVRIEICFERFVSLKEKHVIGQKVFIKVLEGKTTLELRSGIRSGKRYGDVHFKEMQVSFQRGIMQCAETTRESEITFITSSMVNVVKVDNNNNKIDVESDIILEKEKVTASCKILLKEGETLTLEKLSRIITSRDRDCGFSHEKIDDEERIVFLQNEREQMKALMARGYTDVLSASKDCWKALWEERDVMISGEADSDQLGIRFAIYHLTVMSPIHDNRMNIGAKGLSGKGYFGHTFWDTEIYMLPYFVWSDPKGARSLLEYRYNCLDAARKNAKDSGFEGAKYPWEAAWITDGDTCPETHFTQYELHVTADVAFGVYYYYEITHDMDFMLKYGCEIIFETAQFWKSRLEYNADNDRYEISNVIGPDEFTHEANNNAFTNYLTHLNLKMALQWKELLEKEFPKDYARLNKKLGLESRMNDWSDREAKLFLPKANEDNILPQDDDYLTLPEIDLSIYRRGEKKLRVDYPYPTYTRLKVSKQADVMNLFILQEELFSNEVKRASLAYYEPFCVHESSLSLCAYSMLAADCKEAEKAYELFEKAGDIDLNVEKDSEHGIHAASLGGIWQCCVLGFAGVRMCGGKMRIIPNLPQKWNKVNFRIWWRESYLEVTVTKDRVDVEVLQGPKNVEIITK